VIIHGGTHEQTSGAGKHSMQHDDQANALQNVATICWNYYLLHV